MKFDKPMEALGTCDICGKIIYKRDPANWNYKYCIITVPEEDNKIEREIAICRMCIVTARTAFAKEGYFV